MPGIPENIPQRVVAMNFFLGILTSSYSMYLLFDNSAIFRRSYHLIIIQIKSKVCLYVRLCVCLSVCMVRLGDQLDGFIQSFLEVLREVQGNFS